MADYSGHDAVQTVTKEERPMITLLPNTLVMCEHHAEEPVVLFCKICLTYICSECMETEHPSHKSEVLSAKVHNKKVLDDMPDHLKALQNNNQSKTAAATQLQLYLTEQERALTVGIQARQDWKDEVIAQLDEERRALVEEIELVFEEKKVAVKEAREKDLQEFSNEMEQQITDLKEAVKATKASARDIKLMIDKCGQLSESVLLRDMKDLFPSVLREVQTSETPAPDPPPPPPALPDAGAFSSLGIKLVQAVTKDAETVSMMEDVDYIRRRVEQLDMKQSPSGPTAVVRSSYFTGLETFRLDKTTTIPAPMQTLNASEECKTTSLTTLSLGTCQELAQLLGGHVLVQEQRELGAINDDVLVAREGDITHVNVNLDMDGESSVGSWWFPCHKTLKDAVSSAMGYTASRVQQEDTTIGKKWERPDIGATTCLAWRTSAPNNFLDIFGSELQPGTSMCYR